MTFGPAGLRLAVAAVLLVLCTAHCTQVLNPGRRRARATGPADAAVAEIAMAGAMAWLLLAPPPPPRAALAATFGAAGVWFAVRAVRGYVLAGRAGADPFHSHAACCAAMGYMMAAPGLAAVVRPDSAGMSMGVGVPALTALAAGAVAVSLAASVRPAVLRTPVTGGGRWAVGAVTLGMLLAMF